MSLRLIKTELRPDSEQRLVRMMGDALALQQLPAAEVRAAYEPIEALRDHLSLILDRVDRKHV